MIRVGIVGGTGYTGVELLRILSQHPFAEIVKVTSRSDQGKRVDEVYPNLRGLIDCAFVEPDPEQLECCQAVFFATPNGTCMRMAPDLIAKGIKVIDLAADFRLKNPSTFEQWYGEPHSCPDLLKTAVYGLPEINREEIKKASLIACPGCYPTAVQLGLLPIMAKDFIDLDRIIADVKSGVSGAGRKAEIPILMSETGESFKAYGVQGHRHWPEITQGLEQMAGKAVGLTFVPHLTPMIRGIHATLYVNRSGRQSDLQDQYEQYYKNEPFVDVLPAGSHPDTRNVRGSNRCQIAVHQPVNSNTIVILSVIDNLVKGASGQAVQNFNLMFDLPETSGLGMVGLYP